MPSERLVGSYLDLNACYTSPLAAKTQSGRYFPSIPAGPPSGITINLAGSQSQGFGTGSQAGTAVFNFGAVSSVTPGNLFLHNMAPRQVWVVTTGLSNLATLTVGTTLTVQAVTVNTVTFTYAGGNVALTNETGTLAYAFNIGDVMPDQNGVIWTETGATPNAGVWTPTPTHVVTATGTHTQLPGELTVVTSGTFTITMVAPTQDAYSEVVNNGTGSITMSTPSGTLTSIAGVNGNVTVATHTAAGFRAIAGTWYQFR